MYNVLVLKSQGLDDVPAEIQVAPLGDFVDASGRPFRVTEEDVAAIIANAGKAVNDRVIDYEHQTLNGGQAPAAAWIKRLINKGAEGLWAEVEWTGKAREYLGNREYRYLSPVLLSNTKHPDGHYRAAFFHSAALTNTPQIDGMVPIVNKLDPHNRKEEKSMDKILELLGLKPEATEDEAVEALTALRNKAENPEAGKAAPADVLEALGLEEGASLSEVTGTIHAMKQPASAVSVEEFEKLKKDLAERNRDELVAHAMKEGKITADQKEWAEKYALDDPEGFRVFVNKAPKVVPTGKLPTGGGEERKARTTEGTMHVAKMFGLSKEDLEKYGGVDKDA